MYALRASLRRSNYPILSLLLSLSLLRRTYELRVSNTEAHLYQCHACASNTLLDYCPVVTPSDLQCAIDTRAFWLAWDNDTVLMGEGDRLTQNPRLWREPLLHPILYVGFASQSAGAGIVWSLGL